MHDQTPGSATERITLAIMWFAASAALLAWTVTGGLRYRNVLGIDPAALRGLLALVSAVSLGGMALGVALIGRWRYSRFLSWIITWPLSAFAAWAAAWSVIALLAAPGPQTAVAVLVPVLALYVMHRTRQVAREQGAGDS